MSVLEDVKLMKKQGLPEEDIVKTLQQKGISYREISEAISQSKIRAAVEEPANGDDIPKYKPETFDSSKEQQLQVPSPADPNNSFLNAQTSASPETQPLMMDEVPQEDYAQYERPAQEYSPPAPQQTFSQEAPQLGEYTPSTGYDQGYDQSQYGAYSGGGSVSPDTISEISEQIIAEKMMEIRKHLTNVADFKTRLEAKTESIEERLKRIEKVIDTLQSSVLRKVGDYVTNVDDIKKELIETQKTFSKLVPEIKKHASHPEHKKHEHHSEHKAHKKRTKKKD